MNKAILVLGFSMHSAIAFFNWYLSNHVTIFHMIAAPCLFGGKISARSEDVKHLAKAILLNLNSYSNSKNLILTLSKIMVECLMQAKETL